MRDDFAGAAFTGRAAGFAPTDFFFTMGRAGTPTTTSPAATSRWRVTTAPAPVVAPSPIVTGATSTVPLPMKARLPIRVACFSLPS